MPSILPIMPRPTRLPSSTLPTTPISTSRELATPISAITCCASMPITICLPTIPPYRMARNRPWRELPWISAKLYEVGSRINEPFIQLVYGKGYDHTYVLNKKHPGEFAFCAECISPKTGIVMDVYTTEPGVQLYTGNWMTGNFVGKNGQRYPMRAAICLETQHFPDSPNHENYPSVILRPHEKFESHTQFKFSTRK